ncbi:jg5109 [Pararge aegeria aegeria]|uniref:Jg5109 protein n=1 Tax=Pararge aegeria aegeria TaxID=348720 RepID=A0A8S4RZ06_9NEOP|nr:jg5109 [Pararge aegeria aegeria]
MCTDKSAGDTSDIISDSSGVGTSNSDTTTCSLQTAATVVCLTPYEPLPAAAAHGHLRLNQGDIIEVTGATDDGFLEGSVRGSGASGLFPTHCVQEVRLRQNAHLHQVLSSGPIHHSRVTGRREMALSKTYSATAPRIKKSLTAKLHRNKLCTILCTGRSPAPAPPRRDPRTTLSVGRARAKSMVAGLENGGEKEESCEPLSVAGKSSSAESVQLHGNSNSGTPMSGTPVAPRTASIRARPVSGRITAAELEELFQRQADADNTLVCFYFCSQRGPPPAEAPPPPPDAPASSFRPAAAAKLYASPRDLAAVAYRSANNNEHTLRKAGPLRSWSGPARAHSADDASHQYAQPINLHKGFLRQNSTPAPPIPEPDYSMSESDDDTAPKPKSEPAPVAETSANSNTRIVPIYTTIYENDDAEFN